MGERARQHIANSSSAATLHGRPSSAESPKVLSPPRPTSGSRPLQAAKSLPAFLTPTGLRSPEKSIGTSLEGTSPVMVAKVERHELSFPKGFWLPDGRLRVNSDTVKCTVTVKTSLPGGADVVLRVAVVAKETFIDFADSDSALSTPLEFQVSGIADCDIGALPPTRNGSPRVPKPGSSTHEWREERSERDADEVSVTDARKSRASGCQAVFRRALALHVEASCITKQDGRATLQVSISGELRLLPRFLVAGHESMLRLYKMARKAFVREDDTKALAKCEEALLVIDDANLESREVGDVLNLMGAILLRTSSASLAVERLEKSLAIREKQGGQDELPLASTLSSLGMAHQSMGDYQKALQYLERACSILQTLATSAGPALASALFSLGSVQRAIGKHRDSGKCFQRCLAIREQHFGADHALIASTLNNLGAELQQLCEHQEAIRCYHRALAIESKLYGQDHATTVATLTNLGSAHSSEGEHQSAIDCHKRAMAISEKIHGKESTAVGVAMHNLGNTLAAAGKGHDAVRYHLEALDIWAKHYGDSHPDIAATLHSLGNVYRGLGQSEAASQCFVGALRMREAILGPTHTDTARTRHCAALVSITLGEHESALQELEAATKSLVAGLGPGHPWTMQARADFESLKQGDAS